MSSIITLTTDFGLTGAYVASMKGVIQSINPEAVVVDICNTISPQDITQAAFILGTASQYFPKGTVHLVVVDPGVGSERRAIVLRTESADFVAPDNGVLSYVIKQSSIGPDDANQQSKMAPGLKAFAITNPRYWRNPVSPTFHGRDIFAPVSAHLSLGHSPAYFGEEITSLETLKTLQLPRPHRESSGSIIGHILHIDSFGNLITDVPAQNLPNEDSPLHIQVGSYTIHGLTRTYAEGEGLLALVGSSDRLEISVKGGNAHNFLNARIGDEVRISLQQ